MNSLPRTIPEYLEQLRRALAGADLAMIQDALYDAEEYLRSELAEHPGRSEAEVIAAVASSYGAPDEVADIYRDTEATVQTALRSPAPRPRRSLAGRFFGVAADPRSYASLFYMVLALATGIFYFTWVVAGFSISAGLSVTIVGIPLLILFFGSVRVLSLVEGRIVEVMLGERMPRRPLYSARGRSIWQRIVDMFTDPRTWSTLLYMLLMLPLGVVYFTLAVSLLAVGVSFVLAPLAVWTGLAEEWAEHSDVVLVGINGVGLQAWELVLMLLAGVVLLFATLHLARAIGRGHGLLAKHLLVKTAQYS
ncbi:sensor domain-containing protein [Luteimonas sp. MC1750]|uniref:sensor domain-containing protein n=1 Tax=Luteimonas sp. MC1750 TaxID=2799326 RepID=UPI0018F0661E|nr:sensor domain-containing protein [Luteimonas sp. MC1750]MBJ6983770.1 sensor domain-containing protein [Luteimonas sp. MC1750]QQO06600.1 sensor domain-containing protein [Luteimonas sp. MC1750]